MSSRVRKTAQFAVVEWLDAFWHEEHQPGEGVLTWSTGIVVERTRKAIKIAQTVDAERDPEFEEDPARDVLTIPRAMIRSIDIVHVRPYRTRDTSCPRPKRNT